MSEVPTCAQCSSLIGRRPNTWEAEEWKCSKSRTGIDRVSGSPVYALTCYAAREEGQACGPAGTLFELYVQHDYSPPAGKRAAPSTKTADELLGELNL